MDGLEDALNKILSSPGDMEKIMGLAQELSSAQNGSQKREAEGGEPRHETLDPRLLQLVTRLMGEYAHTAGDKERLAEALKPYLKEERRGDLDRAVKMVKLAKLARLAMDEMGGELFV